MFGQVGTLHSFCVCTQRTCDQGQHSQLPDNGWEENGGLKVGSETMRHPQIIDQYQINSQ
jgi:hypothetical protein